MHGPAAASARRGFSIDRMIRVDGDANVSRTVIFLIMSAVRSLCKQTIYELTGQMGIDSTHE